MENFKYCRELTSSESKVLSKIHGGTVRRVCASKEILEFKVVGRGYSWAYKV